MQAREATALLIAPAGRECAAVSAAASLGALLRKMPNLEEMMNRKQRGYGGVGNSPLHNNFQISCCSDTSVLRLRPLDSLGDVSSYETVEKIIRP